MVVVVLAFRVITSGSLGDSYQEKFGRLDQYMHVLNQLAAEGMEEHLSPLLNTLLQEWAIKEAIELLLRSHNCVTHGLRNEFYLSNELA